MIGNFVFGGKSSREYGLYISGSGVFGAPERDVEKVEIAGRNGDLILDNGRFKNITVGYPAYIHRRFADYAAAARDWLMGSTEYQRLEDSYYPEFFRLGRFVGPLDFDVRFANSGGETNLYFDCKPQRFLKSGEFPVVITGSTTIRNPTSFPALPLIMVYGDGDGSITVNDQTVTVTDLDGSVVIDCDLQDAYSGEVNKNDTISLTDFPTLPPGASEISLSGGIAKLEIIPRWWTL